MTNGKYCILCEKFISHTLVRTNYDEVSHSNFQITRCSGCELTSTNFNYPEEYLDNFYPQGYRDYSGIEQTVQKTIYWYLIRKWARRYQPKSVFEFGFGRGEMLVLFKKLGIDSTGCEINQVHVDKIKETANIVTYVKLENVPYEEYDMLIFYNSLEHLIQIDKYMKFAKKHLGNKGTVIVTIPNFDSLQSRILKDKWVHLDTPRHLTHFTKDSLCKLMLKYDFKLIALKKGSIVYDAYGWLEGFLFSIRKSGGLNKNNRFAFVLRKILIVSVLGFVAPVATLLARAFGDRALLEAHFQHGSKE